MYWVNLVHTKVKLWVRVSPSAFSIRLYSSRHDEERHNHILEGQQRNMLQGERNARIHACMYSFITSLFLGSYIKTQNAFTTQPKPHDACDTVCQCCVHKKNVFVDTVCTSTTVPFLPRRRLIRFGRHQIPRPLCLTESGVPASSAVESRGCVLYRGYCEYYY